MQNNIIKIIVKTNDSKQTIFNFIKKMFKTNNLSVIYKLFRNKKIKVNGKVIKERNYWLQENDIILIFDRNLVISNRNNKNVKIKADLNKLKVIYEDNNILIVNKPHNVEMHSSLHDSLDNIVKNYLIKKDNNFNDEQSFIISHVHRIDKFARGLVIYAKNKKTLDSLLSKINDKKYIEKVYLAKVEGKITLNETIKGYLTKNKIMKIMVFTKNILDKTSKKCETWFRTLKIINNNTWLEIKLSTGRKHQIRASLSYLHHPIVNDIKYNAKKNINSYMIYLYAYKIEFNHFTDHLSYLNKNIFKLPENIIK